MAHSLKTPRTPALSSTVTTSVVSLDRALPTAGAIARPMYIGVGLAQALLRPGFDLMRHDLSPLSNGDLGWIQSAISCRAVCWSLQAPSAYAAAREPAVAGCGVRSCWPATASA